MGSEMCIRDRFRDSGLVETAPKYNDHLYINIWPLIFHPKVSVFGDSGLIEIGAKYKDRSYINTSSQ